MVYERIKQLREKQGYTQTEPAKMLGVTRSSVNAWEQGISVPSTQYIVELSALFGVSTDYLLGVRSTATLSVAGLTERDILAVAALIQHLRSKNQS